LTVLFLVTAGVAITIYSIATFGAEINKNSGIITLIFSGVVAVSTLIYAILTWRLVSETKKMRAVQTDPKILVEVRPKGSMLGEILTYDLNLFIRNIGLGPAYDINFKILKDRLNGFAKKVLEGSNVLKHVEYLAPNDEISIMLTFVPYNSEELTNFFLEIEAKYYKYPKETRTTQAVKWLNHDVSKEFTEVFPIDFAYVMELLPLAGSNALTALQGIKAELAEIRKLLKH
jgi:hypothetical protein